MKEIRTTTDIDAPLERVWELLSDFESWGDWNPVIPRVRGRLEAGAPVDIQLAVGGRRVPIKVRILRADPDRELRWRGPRSGVQARLFGGEHYFSLEKIDETHTRFIHGERFKGLLVPVVWSRLEPLLRKRYTQMNDAVKSRSESAG
jgi:hypothetical protein